MSDGYRRQRQWYGDYGGSLLVTALTGQTTLLVGKPLYTIFVQRIHIHVTAAAAQTWDVQDSAGNSYIGPMDVSSHVTTVGSDVSIPTQDPIQAEYDYGPFGVALPVGTSLIFVPSGIGAKGIITWDAYQRQTGLVSISNFGGLQSSAGGGGTGQPGSAQQ